MLEADSELYIVLFLHQTATSIYQRFDSISCISFYSYIKPQHVCGTSHIPKVVYRSIPTSNRNTYVIVLRMWMLYIVLFLHQTATDQRQSAIMAMLYIVLFLHQTATNIPIPVTHPQLYIVLFLHQTATQEDCHGRHAWLYIVLFLHQTATDIVLLNYEFRCISFYSYIKPQRERRYCYHTRVVYRSIPTSNRNSVWLWNQYSVLYIVLFLHQTATTK